MLLNGTHNPVETSGDITSRSFRILASKKAFEILSSGLYSHKIKAIVRELGTNAADAHTAAGTTEPFSVQLPNKLFAYFEVKDFGTGLSEDAVLNLYTTYFGSDKTNSNAFTGCLGLGSKSPFSYTDSFTVESRFEGTKTSYTAYLDAHGIPAVSKQLETATDEPNGLTVRIPVQTDDFNEFHAECREVYQWFKVRPTIHGTFAGYPEHTVVFEGDGYTIGRAPAGENDHYKHYSPATLVMGNVAYPLDYSRIGTLRNWRDYGIVLYADIGDVEIAASREALSYDERTLEYLRGRGEELNTVLPQHATAYVAEAETLWAARVRLWQLRGLLKDLRIKADWQGIEIEPEVKVETVPVTVTRDDGTTYTHQEYEIGLVHFKWTDGRYNRKSYTRPIKHEVTDARSIIPTTAVWLADTTGWKNALTGVLAKDERVYVITSVHEKSDFLSRTGVDAVLKRTSSIPKEQHHKVVREKKDKVARATLYEFSPNGGGDSGNINNCSFWKKVETAPKQGVYVVIDRFEIVLGAGNNHTLKHILPLLATLGCKPTVYGVRQVDKDKLGKNWKLFSELKEATVAQAAKELEARSANGLHASNGVLEVVKGFSEKDLTPNLKKLKKRHPLRKAVETYLAAKKENTYAKIKAYRALCNHVVHSPEAKKSQLETALNTVKETYPLLPHLQVPYYAEGTYADAVFSYIALVDGATK